MTLIPRSTGDPGAPKRITRAPYRQIVVRAVREANRRRAGVFDAEFMAVFLSDPDLQAAMQEPSFFDWMLRIVARHYHNRKDGKA